MPWPNISQYNDAFQNHSLCLADLELKAGEPELDQMGLPRQASGSFASVYSLRCGNQRWAVRCFLRDLPDNKARYKAIDTYLSRIHLSCTVGFEYQERGILIGGDWYPLVKMEWVQGLPLNRYIEKNLHQPAVLAKLAQDWKVLVQSLQQGGIAHGDLQHGNVLVSEDGKFHLIDYDGMYVPELQGRGSNESGHPSYQHPLRAGKHYSETTDRFSALAIYVAIHATRVQPKLWHQFNNDDNLLFQQSDFHEPGHSLLFAALAKLDSRHLRRYITTLREACDLPVEQVPDALADRKVNEANTEPPIDLVKEPETPKKQKERRIIHRSFGEGVIQKTEIRDNKESITVQFDSGKPKQLLGSHESITYIGVSKSASTAEQGKVTPVSRQKLPRQGIDQRSAPNKKGWPSIHSATINDKKVALEYMLKAGANPNLQAKSGQTALHCAAIWGQVDCAILLMDHKANINARDEDNMTPLHHAAQQEQVTMIELLLERGANAKILNKSKLTAYELAPAALVVRSKLWSKESKSVVSQVTVSAVPNAQQPTLTPSQSKVSKPIATLEAVTATSDKPLITNAAPRGPSRVTPAKLKEFIISGDISLVRNALMSDPTLLNSQKLDTSESTPLIVAVLTQSVAVVDFLLQCQPQFLLKDRFNRTARDWATILPDPAIRQLLSVPEAANRPATAPFIPAPLVAIPSSNASPPLDPPLTPLLIAVCNHNFFGVKRLLENSPDSVNEADTDGNTLLHHAVQAQNAEIIDLLLEYKADANKTNHAGISAATLANTISNPELIKRLSPVKAVTPVSRILRWFKK